uniref:Uncharacterized protein n=1 Tax=Ditylenchus dipsaci TaxID=166011 RepID=A0A915ET94_9BILA
MSNVSSGEASKRENPAKKQKIHNEFDRLMTAVENKKELQPFALEINDLLEEVKKAGGQKSLLLCKADFRAVISEWEGNFMDMIDANPEVAEQDIRNVVDQWDDNLVNIQTEASMI